ncbi:winged helix-turn-helix domain-containing protein [Acidobacteria bacterium AH-259-L09]|nr:winged helix-turn-helix domain-containing protein [Acidobacteria bacterium AH-259-L09]
MQGDFQIGQWLIQPQLNRIVGAEKETRLEPKAMDVLVCLAEHGVEVISKERIIQAVWPDTFVTDEVLTRAIWELRKAFEDNAKDPQVIQTIPRRGYRLSIEVAQVETKRFKGTEPPTDAGKAQRSWQQLIPWVLGSMVVGAMSALFTVWNLSPSTEPRSVMQFVITLPPTAPLQDRASIDLAISPDGSQIVYLAERDGRTQLYVRALDELRATPIPGTEGAETFPFFSPDGKWVGFFAHGKLKKVSLTGGAPMTLCSARSWRGGSWNSQDTIVFSAPSIKGGAKGLYRVSAAGGKPESLVIPDPERGELRYTCPKMLPSGKAVLFDVRYNDDRSQIRVLSLETGEQKIVVDDGINAYYAPTGHLVCQLGGALMAVPFDLERLEVTGDPVPILEGVRGVDYALSGDGTLVYVPGSAQRTLVWVNREGQEEPLAADPQPYYRWPRVSPDGTRLALTVADSGNWDVWIHDLVRETPTRLTFDPARDDRPLWTLDGLRVVFSSSRDGGHYNLFWKSADGIGPVERLTRSQNRQIPNCWSPDGKLLVFYERNFETGWDLGVLPMEGEPTAESLLQTQFAELNPVISPDGRWIAYTSDESGRMEVYVRPFPNVEEGKWQISSDGGITPVWGPNGRELFYRNGEAMMVVSIETEPTFAPGSPEVLFTGRYFSGTGRHYDISPDGQRFLMIKEQQTEETSARDELVIVLNWFEELKRLVPTGE